MRTLLILTTVLMTQALLGLAGRSQEAPAKIRVAAISFKPQKLNLEANAEVLENSFRSAAMGGAKIAVAPEGALDGYVINDIIAGEITTEQLREVSIAIEDPVMLRFQTLAAELKMCLAFGFAERIGDDLFNCAIFLNDEGKVAGKYHKMQFAEGYDSSWWWNRLGAQSRAFDTPYGRAGFMICNDRWNPELARIPVLDGARFLMIPAFGSRSKSQDEAVRGRAKENGVPVIEANVGVTMIVDESGNVIAQDRNEVAITYGEIAIPAAPQADEVARDRVELSFLNWRHDEMSKRYHKWSGERRARNIDYDTLANGPMKVELLPGHDRFTFTMYGCPGQLEDLKSMVETMQHHQIGNGFDPGPGVHPSNQKHFEFLRDLDWPVVGYANTSDHQVKEGTCRLTDEQDKILRILDDAGIFTATQIGEWGYYFHNLSHRESWWHAVYGEDFDQWSHLMKPKGLAGYDSMPKNKRECYGIVEDYFRTRQRYMRGWNLSITGHSHYEAYAGQWGAKVIGLELGENIAFTQSKIAFARGAARRNGKPWSIQVSQWFNGSTTSSGPLQINENGTARGLDAGHSLSFYQRMWLHAWFAGTAMVTPEASIAIFFESERPPYKLTSHGRKAAEVFQFMRQKEKERGIPFAPMAVVVDRDSGYNGYMGKPWGILKPTQGDLEIQDLLEAQLFPGSDHIHETPFPDNPEASYLRPTPFGEFVDVQLSDVPSNVLASYPVVLLAGDHNFTKTLIDKLVTVTNKGTRLLVSDTHAKVMEDTHLAQLTATNRLEVLKPWIHPTTKRSTAISNARLREIVSDYMPVEVSGSPVLYQINRNPTGWVVELVNNDGVVKFPTKPAQVDLQAIAEVTIKINIPCNRVHDWRTGDELRIENGRVELTIKPGETRFLKFHNGS